jgi:hypothetical protein
MGTNSLTVLAIDDHQDHLTSLKAVVADAFPSASFLGALNGDRGLELALIATFFGVVGCGILLVGYLFNVLM